VRTDANNRPVVAWTDSDKRVNFRAKTSAGWAPAETLSSFDYSTIIRNLNLSTDSNGEVLLAYDTKSDQTLSVWAHRRFQGTWMPLAIVDSFKVPALADSNEEQRKYNPTTVLSILPGGLPALFWHHFEPTDYTPHIKSSTFK
jgi:hypothetical protein